MQQKDGERIHWNKSYYLNTASMTARYLRWLPTNSNQKDFVWTRVADGKQNQGAQRSEKVWDNPHVQAGKMWQPINANRDEGNVKEIPQHHNSSRTETHTHNQKWSHYIGALVGQWHDLNSATYDVTWQSNDDEPSCLVSVSRLSGHTCYSEGVIQLKEDGWTYWGSNFYLQYETATSTFVRWMPSNSGNPFTWIRAGFKGNGQDLLDLACQRAGSNVQAENDAVLINGQCVYGTLVGIWQYHTSVHEVVADTNGDPQVPKWFVTTRVPSGRNFSRLKDSVIQTEAGGRVVWNNTHVLDICTITRGHVRWLQGGRALSWTREFELEDASPKELEFDFIHSVVSPTFDVARAGIAEEALPSPVDETSPVLRAGKPHTAPPGLIRGPKPHFCLFQGDGVGISGWTRHEGSRGNRWDTILLSLLQSTGTDVAGPGDVRSSAYVGSDVVHVDGHIQQHTAPAVGGPQVMNPKAWADMLWKNKGRSSPGLLWEINGPQRSLMESQKRLLNNLDALLCCGTANSVAIAFNYRKTDKITYDDLWIDGAGRQAYSEKVYLLFGSAHGFDGKDDADGWLLDSIMELFKARLGAHRVVCVNLCSSDTNRVKFPSAKIAGFLSAEHTRGALGQVVAGLEARAETSALNLRSCQPLQ